MEPPHLSMENNKIDQSLTTSFIHVPNSYITPLYMCPTIISSDLHVHLGSIPHSLRDLSILNLTKPLDAVYSHQ